MPRKPSPHTDPPTTDRLRSDIDSGKTEDKVRYPDPAAAPLGSDAEASGNPPTARERHKEADSRQTAEEPPRRDPQALWVYSLLVGGVLLIVLAIAFIMLS